MLISVLLNLIKLVGLWFDFWEVRRDSMSKNIFINNLDTYVSQAIFKELRNDQPGEDGEPNPDAHNIFGTYISKDSSLPPEGIKKMLKVSAHVAENRYRRHKFEF